MKRIIAITGGIGAGKSVVSRVLRNLGYPVYDCDAEAKALMDCDVNIREQIATDIDVQAINSDGTINRPLLSSIVFSNPEKLLRLNGIVHGAVRNHFVQWVKDCKSSLIFVETAILYESEFYKLVNDVWEVTAPDETRIERVMNRNGISREEVEMRIKSQSSAVHPAHAIIINDDRHPIIPRVLQLLSEALKQK